jgi:hypothetical protein
MTPQTVGFELEVRYDQMERPSDLPRTKEFVFHSFDKMPERMRVEKRRRKLADRATSGRYRMFLTDHGKQACAADIDTRNRHQEAIEGTWFNM